MVQWKGDITRDESGDKAWRLDSVERLKVPNFFTITRSEIREITDEIRNPEELQGTSFSGDTWDDIQKAYDEIGMSSEVREASGKARNLVGGQRNGQRVSVRVSGSRKGVFDYQLNVGASNLEDAVKEVVASYHHRETEHDYPAVIIQQMVEPGYSGAVIMSYLGSYSLLETVEGLGTAIEKGITTPAFYLKGNGVEKKRIPDQQVVVERNRMNGNHEKKTVRPEPPFGSEEVEKFLQSLREENMDAKFVYKRGSFYVVDVMDSSNSNPFGATDTSLNGIRVSEGRIEGQVGKEVALSSDTAPPDRYSDALVARKGGYTSTHAQLARQEERPAIFSFNGDLEQGEHVSVESSGVEPEEMGEPVGKPGPEQDYAGANEMASEVIPINSGNGIYLNPPFTKARYAVTDRRARCETIPRNGYITTYGEVFAFNGDKAVLDVRKLGGEGLEEAMNYLEADTMILLLDYPDPGLVRNAIEAGFDTFATQGSTEQLEKVVSQEERRFIIDRLRELSK